MGISSTFSRLMLALFLAMAALTGTAADENSRPPVQVQADMLDGTRYSLADSHGTIVLLAIWSPESLASRKSIGELERFAAASRPRGVTTIAVSTLRDPKQLQRFISERGLSVPVAMLGEHNLGPLPKQHLPVLYVFDRNGRLHSMRAGLYSLRTLERLVEPLLGQ